jgi:predicted phage tail protein
MIAPSSIQGSGGGGGKGGGSSGRVAQEAPNTLQSVSTARVIDLISEGEIWGLVDGAKSIFFDGTPLQNADGSYNFDGVSWDFRPGTSSQSYLPGFPSVESEIPVGVEVKYTSAVVRTITEATADALRLTIRLPALYQQDVTNGDMNEATVVFKIEVQPYGGSWAVARTEELSGKCTSPYERAYRIELPPGGNPWTVRVVRLSPDSDSSALQNKMIWSSYTVLTDAKLCYPNSAVMALTVDARLFGSSIPTRSYDTKGLLFRVPSNYNPETRAYSGIWDGTWQVAWSDNPAWFLYDLLTHPRYGLGRQIDESQVDKWGFYSIAQYCDELVPDGSGGEEPRFTFNGVINTREDAYRVLQSITSAFRGMVYWSSGAVTSRADMPEDATRIMTPANVIGGDFSYSGTALKARHTVAMVAWNDPADGYKTAIEVVENPDLIHLYGWREVEITAFGCTSQGQAHRQGKWILESEQHQTRTVTFRVSFNEADLAPGQIIKIADPTIDGARYGGRILSATALSLTLDAPVTLTADEDYTVTVKLPDGTLETRPVSNGPGETSVLTFLSHLPTIPMVGAVWILSPEESSISPQYFRVMSNREIEPNVFEIIALEHDENKYLRVEENLVLDPISYTRLENGNLPRPLSLSARHYLHRVGGVARMAVAVSWEVRADPRVASFEVQIKPPGSYSWKPLIETAQQTAEIGDARFGVYGIRVRARDAYARGGPWLVNEAVEVLEGVNPPETVGGFSISVIDGAAHLAWDPVGDLDLASYRLKYAPQLTGASWASAADLVPKIAPSASAITVPAMIGTYLIKAINTAGRESLDAALIVTTVTSLAGLNVVETVTESPVWAGQKDGVVYLSDLGMIQLDSTDSMDDWPDFDAVLNADIGLGNVRSEGIYYFKNMLDLGAAYTSRVTPSIVAAGVDLQNLMDQWENIDSVPLFDGADPSQWTALVQLRTTNGDPAGAPVWSDWQTLIVGDYTARAFEFRLVLKSFANGISVQVSSLSVTVDMPDRMDGGNDIFCPATGLSVHFVPPFHATPALAIAGQGLATGDYYTITDKSRSGFNIRFFNAAGTGVDRTIDWVAKGYGKEG